MTERNKILLDTAKDLMRQIAEAIKKAEAAPNGHKIKALLLNENAPKVRELATALDIGVEGGASVRVCGAYATLAHFPEEYAQFAFILVPERDGEGYILKAGTKDYDLSILNDSTEGN